GGPARLAVRARQLGDHGLGAAGRRGHDRELVTTWTSPTTSASRSTPASAASTAARSWSAARSCACSGSPPPARRCSTHCATVRPYLGQPRHSDSCAGCSTLVSPTLGPRADPLSPTSPL